MESFIKGKEKLQTSMDISALRSEILERQKNRSRLMLQIGEIAYSKIRRDEIASESFEEYLDKIKEIDRAIFNYFKILDEKTRKDEGMVCECGEELMPDSKFCGSCGKEIVEEARQEDFDCITCNSCGESIIASSKFCSSCGFKTS